MDRVCMWRNLTGGGLPVDYLCWLAAMWEQFVDWYAVDGDHYRDRMGQFDDWLIGRINADLTE
jgi:hypothetical protein